MIELMQHCYIEGIVDVHIESFPDSFLTQLGKPFLTILYNEIASKGYGHVYLEGEDVAGFLAGIYDTADIFYRNLIKMHFLHLIYIITLAILRKPSVFLPIFHRGNRLFRNKGTIQKISDPEYDLVMTSGGKIAFALTMAVSKLHRGKGIAKQLWIHSLHELPKQRVDAIIGSVQSDNNITNNFYEKMGFKKVLWIRRNYTDEEYKWLFYWRDHCSVSDNGRVTWFN